jgi:dolichyl-phosphate-mannose-protein mannosyltransferase
VETDTILLTHDVASPLLSTNEEITTVDPESRYNETLFKLVLEDSNSNSEWNTQLSPFKLLHMDTKVALWTHDQALPEWGLGLQDVNGNKNTKEASNFWVAQEIMGKNGREIKTYDKRRLDITNAIQFTMNNISYRNQHEQETRDQVHVFPTKIL